MSAKDWDNCPRCIFVPSVASAVAIGINVSELPLCAAPHRPPCQDNLSPSLNITREQLVAIFERKITKWSELKDRNPVLANVHEEIRIIVRKDKSGTTTVFTQALASFSEEWKTNHGSFSKSDQWPAQTNPIKLPRTEGVARGILSTKYSIGYLSIAGAKQWLLSVAQISNRANNFVHPADEKAVQAAMSSSLTSLGERKRRGDLYVEIVDPAATSPTAYPIATLTYLAFDESRLKTDYRKLFNVIYWTRLPLLTHINQWRLRLTGGLLVCLCYLLGV